MKILKMMIAATLVAGAAGAAHADRVVVHRTTVVKHHTVRPAHRHRVCNTHWYHHRKVKRCYWR